MSLEQVFKNLFWSELVNSWDKSLDEGRIFECAFTCGQKLTKVWDQNKLVKDTYRYYVTGNNRGLGLELSKHFSADGSSRTSGLDITKDIDKIVEESVHFDVFINNAFDGPPDTDWANYAQTKLLTSRKFPFSNMQDVISAIAIDMLCLSPFKTDRFFI